MSHWKIKNLSKIKGLRSVTVSNSVKHEIISRFNINENNVSVISPYVSDNFYPLNRNDELRKELGLPLDKKLILSVSSDQPRKNLSMVRGIIIMRSFFIFFSITDSPLMI